MAEIYRGYDIGDRQPDGYRVIRKDGVVVSSQPSLEFAYSFIDREIKKQREAKQ